MDTATRTVAHGTLSGFLRRWLGAWMLATALSSFLLALADALASRGRAGWAGFVVFGGLLSFPALVGLLQGVMMRGLLRRSALWGALTGAGIVVAVTSIAVMFLNFRDLWWPLVFRITIWIARTLGVVPSAFVGAVLASVLFGLIVSTAQAVALGPRWRSVSAWVATSTAAAIPAGLWIYAWVTAEPISALFVRIADLMPLTGRWRYVPVSVLWAEVATLFFALPTGIFMHRLLRRHRRADAEALVRRFE